MRTNESLQAVPMEIDQAFNATALGLKEISNLASWTVSSSKPGCGVEALRDEDTGLFWQYANYTMLARNCANGSYLDQTAHNLTI